MHLPQVPFAYSLQALYLVRHDPRLQPPALLAIALLNGAGYAVPRRRTHATARA